MKRQLRFTPRSVRRLCVAVVMLALCGVNSAGAGSGDARSNTHRMIAGSAASVAGSAATATHQAYVVGGSGAAVGIAASANASVVAGNSTVDPTVRIFSGNFETY
jgi:hypothetical protein